MWLWDTLKEYLGALGLRKPVVIRSSYLLVGSAHLVVALIAHHTQGRRNVPGIERCSLSLTCEHVCNSVSAVTLVKSHSIK
jgi:hypothetical protein